MKLTRISISKVNTNGYCKYPSNLTDLKSLICLVLSFAKKITRNTNPHPIKRFIILFTMKNIIPIMKPKLYRIISGNAISYVNIHGLENVGNDLFIYSILEWLF